MHPVQILDMQADLLTRLDGYSEFHEMIAGSLSLAMVQKTGRAMPDQYGEEMTQALVNCVKAAYAYRVTPDMCDVLEGISWQLTNEDTFHARNAPTGCGIVRFDQPLPVYDKRGMKMEAHWMIWGPAYVGGESAVATFWFNDADAPDEVSIEMIQKHPDIWDRLRRLYGRWSWIGFNAFPSETPLGEPLLHVAPSDYELDATDRAFQRDYPDLAHLPIETDITNLKRYVHALWLLLNQSIAHVSEAEIPRASRRRMEKARLPGRVTVIAMRRYENETRTDGETHVEWQHRWLVRGHLAWRRCGPDKPGAEEYAKGWRRRIWIPSYVKGPDGLPFKVTEKIYDLKR